MTRMTEQADRAALIRAFEAGRADQDLEAMASAARALAADRRFGTPLGRTAGYLHEAYRLSTGAQRVQLAVELARTWVYGSEPDRAVPFAAEAVALAGELGDPALVADALDAELLVHWGPDQLAERLAVTARLEDTVAHVTDVEARLSAHLWRLTTAVESLDSITIQRQLRALDDLAAETGSPRVRMFAASRRGMTALIAGDLAAARDLLAVAERAGTLAGEPDAEALVHELAAGIAVQAGDRAELTRQAAAYQDFGTAHGIRSILAEGAVLWLAAGRLDRARQLLEQIARPELATIPRDVDWLLTVALVTEVAAGTAALDVAAEAIELLAPYAGRGVVNAGAVSFLGVADDYLRQACAALGRADEAQAWARSATACYTRIGAAWWLGRLAGPSAADAPAVTPADSAADAPADPPAVEPLPARLVPGLDGIWTVGLGDRAVAVRDGRGLRYLRLLLERPGVPVSALDLTAAVAGHRAPPAEAGLGEVIDRRALAAYRSRLTAIDDDLAEARSWADPSRAAALSAERGMLLDEIAAATGLAGRPREQGGAAERARVAVRKALAAAIERIAAADPQLGRLLRQTVRTGSTCCYQPDPTRPIRWVLRD
jgi:tetratricopeptide (TPR) repeat protein